MNDLASLKMYQTWSAMLFTTIGILLGPKKGPMTLIIFEIFKLQNAN